MSGGINNYLARSAREVLAARNAAEHPPAIDVQAWHALVNEARRLNHQGEDAKAEALIDQWHASELGRLQREAA